MSEENVEIVRAMLEMFRNRDHGTDTIFGKNRDLAVAAEVLHPEVEWDATRVPVDDIRGMYHGHQGVLEFWQNWLEAWDTVEVEDDPELIDAGDHVFLWVEHQRMRGRGSGVEVDFPPWAYVMSFIDGKIVRTVFYTDRREALEAAGLSA
jgi:ketosteroid isomerase-like protein